MERFEAILYFLIIPLVAGIIAMIFTSGLIVNSDDLGLTLIVAIFFYCPVLVLSQFFLILIIWFLPTQKYRLIGIISAVIYLLFGLVWAYFDIGLSKTGPGTALFYVVTSCLVVGVNAWMASIVSADLTKKLAATRKLNAN